MAPPSRTQTLIPRLPRSDHVPRLPIVHHHLIHTLVTVAGTCSRLPMREKQSRSFAKVRDNAVAAQMVAGRACGAARGRRCCVRRTRRSAALQAQAQSALAQAHPRFRPSPSGRRRPAPSPVALEAKTQLVEFENAPFPFDSGTDPRRRKTVSLENERYSDPRVLLHIPQGLRHPQAGRRSSSSSTAIARPSSATSSTASGSPTRFRCRRRTRCWWRRSSP